MPPDRLAEKGILNWTKKEALEYFDWFMSVKDRRLQFFLSFFDITYSRDPDILFSQSFSKWVYHLFNNNPVLTVVKKKSAPSDSSPDLKYIMESEPARQELTDIGYTIAADGGILYAACIIDNRPDKVWDIAMKGGKRYINYHKVVVKNQEDMSSEWDLIGMFIQHIGYSINYARTPYDHAGFIKGIINKL